MATIDKTKLPKKITDKYSVVNNSFVQVAKANPKDKIEVEIGDTKQADFFPQVKVQRWDNECNVSIRLKETDSEIPEIKTSGDKIQYVKSKLEAHFYDINNAEHPEGASEFEIILKEKPLTNVIEFTLNDKDVEYFYQPPLTQEEIDQGSNRPDNVIGSYAVYAKTPKTNWTGGKEYKVGKIGHIFRPKIIDSAGTEVWGELHIENGILSVTIPQDFLDKAVYPVRHAAGLEFGFHSNGNSVTNVNFKDSLAYAILPAATYTAGSAGTATLMSAYLKPYSSSYYGPVKCVIYNYSTTGSQQTKVGNTDAVNTNSASIKWYDYTFASNPSVVAARYFLGFLSDNYTDIGYDNSAGGLYNTKAATYPTFPDPLNINPASGASNYTLSIYATYTTAASGPANLKSRSGNLKANIKSLSGNLIANCKSLSGNS